MPHKELTTLTSWSPATVIRAILVLGTLLIALLSLSLYGLTREVALLQTGSISGMGFAIILPYYFRKEK